MTPGVSDVSTSLNLAMTNDLLAAWEKTLALRSDSRAIIDTRGEVVRTFAQIAAEAIEVERELPHELSPGSVVAIQIGNHPAWPAWLLAVWRRELVVLPLEREMAAAELETALQVCRAAALVSADADGAICLTRREIEAIDWGEAPPVLLKLTSGTTAAPRAIWFRGGQLLADCEQICETMGITETDLNFGIIPVSHSYGFSNLLTPLILRGVPLVLSRDRIPRAVLEDLARTQATIFAGMPVFYQAFVQMDSIPALPKLRLCISAGAPLPLEVAKKFRAKSGHVIHSFYGSSECGGICYDREARLEEPGFVGPPMDGVQIEMLEPQAKASRIEVRSAAVGNGYFPNADEEKLGSGRFVPDDLLIKRGSGFCIVGRVSDFINVAGKKVNPAEVEAALLACPGVSEAVVFGRISALRNEEVVACVVREIDVTETVLLESCRRRLSGWQVPKRIFFVEQLPVNERGKLSRGALAERFAS
jgi:acyl-CoA synthetase (AMP-forming)/AMP-acid ligase II